MTSKYIDNIDERLKVGAFYNLPAETRQQVCDWITQNFKERKNFNRGASAYGVKHILQRETAIYVTTFEFCDAMKECGFEAEQIGHNNFIFNAEYNRPRKKLTLI